MPEELDELETVLKESDAYAAVVFGSYARGENYNDIDVAVFTEEDVEGIVREVSSKFDIQAFNDLPMYVRKRVLEEGELVYCTDKDRFYDEVVRTIKEYEDFKPIHDEYLERVKQRG